MRGFAIMVAAGVLAACNQGGGAAFPDMSSGHYRAEATISHESGQSMPVVMFRDGAKLRMEFASGEGQMAVINNGDTGESFVLMTRDGQTMAFRGGMPGGMQDIANPSDAWHDEAATATRTGSCTVAGESGSEWTSQAEGETTPNVACVTDDGIILRSAQGGQTVWETTSVSRGPQDAALFELPPGVEAIDPAAMMGGLNLSLTQSLGGSSPAAVPSQGAAPGGNAQLCQTLRNVGAPADALARAGC